MNKKELELRLRLFEQRWETNGTLAELLKIYDTRLDKLARRVNDLEKLARLQGEQLDKLQERMAVDGITGLEELVSHNATSLQELERKIKNLELLSGVDKQEIPTGLPCIKDRVSADNTLDFREYYHRCCKILGVIPMEMDLLANMPVKDWPGKLHPDKLKPPILMAMENASKFAGQIKDADDEIKIRKDVAERSYALGAKAFAEYLDENYTGHDDPGGLLEEFLDEPVESPGKTYEQGWQAAMLEVEKRFRALRSWNEGLAGKYHTRHERPGREH